jgi:multiple antibiotic resistance protein
MLDYFQTFIHLVFIGFVALFPVVNPIGVAFMISPFFSDLSRQERLRVAKRIAFYAFIVCTITLLLGHWILELFGISVPIIQLAGGIMICKIGWEHLTADNSGDTRKASIGDTDVKQKAVVENTLFYPITFPITTGAGTMAVLFTLSAQVQVTDFSQYALNMGALLVAVLGICILIFFFDLNTNSVINYIGSHNEKIINRLMAFLTFCVGLQIAVGGITHLVKGT